MRPEEAEVRRWPAKARNDWSAAVKIMRTEEPECDIAAFLCQQAVEKTLKAYLVFAVIPFEKVHDLGLLLDACCQPEAEFESLRETIEPLTIFAVAFRYPGPAEPSHAEVTAALGAVESVWDFVTRRLPEALVPRPP
jgi:HEPN domain-containing protein